jgi:hypothetical protein
VLAIFLISAFSINIGSRASWFVIWMCGHLKVSGHQSHKDRMKTC